MLQIDSDSGNKIVDGIPSDCPFCHKKIIPKPLYGHKNSNILELTFVCPNQECNCSFIAYYNYDNFSGYYNYANETSIGNFIGKEFSEVIVSISPYFKIIYK